MKTEIIAMGIEFQVEAEKIDDSFDHEFGTEKIKPYWECYSVKIGDVELIDVLCENVINKINGELYEIEN